MSIVINGTTGITFPDTSLQTTTGKTGMVNRIINGGMVIDQRRAGTAYTSTNANIYVLDRWQSLETGGVSGTYTIQQNAGAVTPPVGFSNYMGITSLSAFSVTAGVIQTVAQKIEGFNTADLDWGTANAKTVTISFWTRSSLTGTFGGVVSNGAITYSYPFTYTISAANTWEYKTVTIVGPTAGTWVGATNGVGLTLQFVIGTGTTYQGAAGSWSANGYYGVTGAVNVTGTNGATFYITGVQLEKGSTATSFDYRPYGTELALCQRYYYQTANAGTATQVGMWTWKAINSAGAWGGRNFPVQMRATPTVSLYNLTGNVNGASIAENGTNPVTTNTVTNPTNQGIQEISTTGTPWTANQAIIANLTASAEL